MYKKFIPNDGRYYIISAGHSSFLDIINTKSQNNNNNVPTLPIRVWNGGHTGRSIKDIITADSNNNINNNNSNNNNSSQENVKIRWRIQAVANGSSKFYIINDTVNRLIYSHGTSLLDFEKPDDLSVLPSTFHWEFYDCPYENNNNTNNNNNINCYYIVNCVNNMFLDTHGWDVACWNNNGKSLEIIISGNTSQYARNVRWWLVNIPNTNNNNNTTNTNTNTTTNNNTNTNNNNGNSSNNNNNQVRILHLSDTHSMQYTIEKQFPMPTADILLHTGDFTNSGSEAEYVHFNNWLGTIKPRYKHIIMILGNHDRWSKIDMQKSKELLSNAIVLDHEELTVEGIRIFGCSWDFSQPDGNPDKSQLSLQLFSKIPDNVDILLTHCPPYDIFDLVSQNGTWGSSGHLRNVIIEKKPKAHLFGHLHEQRGVWVKEGNKYKGGIEFEAWPYPSDAPPSSYPCQLISCNAMKNHGSWDGKKSCIAGPARLIIATKDNFTGWNFTSEHKQKTN